MANHPYIPPVPQSYTSNSVHNSSPIILRDTDDTELMKIDEDGNVHISKFNGSLIMTDANNKKWKISINTKGKLDAEPFDKSEKIKHRINEILGENG